MKTTNQKSYAIATINFTINTAEATICSENIDTSKTQMILVDGVTCYCVSGVVNVRTAPVPSTVAKLRPNNTIGTWTTKGYTPPMRGIPFSPIPYNVSTCDS